MGRASQVAKESLIEELDLVDKDNTHMQRRGRAF